MADEPVPYTPSQDAWSRLTDEQREKLEYGNECFRVLKRGETLDRWYHAGVGCQELQAAALRAANSNNTSSRAYREAWAQLAPHVPDLMNMDAADRTNAIWVVVNWEPVSNWLRQQPVNIRLSLNHPRSVRRKYVAATKPPPIVKEDGSKPEKRTKDHVIMELQQKLDAALAMKGAGAMPAGMKAEDYADKIADQMALPTLKRFVTALQKRIEADERQNRIESSRKQPRK